MGQDNTNKSTITDEIAQFLSEAIAANLPAEEIKEKMINLFGNRIANGEVPDGITPAMEKQLDELTEKYNPDRRSAVAKELLDKKYNKEFKVLRYRGDKYPEEFFAVDAYEKTHPSMVFEAWISNEEDEVRDSYVVKKACESIRQKIIENLDYYTGDLGIVVLSELLITSLSDDSITYESIHKYLPNNRYGIHLYMNTEDVEGKIEYSDLKQMLKGLDNISGSISLFRLNEEKKEELIRYVSQRAKIYSSYWRLAGDSRVGSVLFEKGVIKTTPEEFTQLLKK